MTITVSRKTERALTAEAARRGTTPDLLAEEILITSLAVADDEGAPTPRQDQILNDLIAKAQMLELPSTPSITSDTPFGEAVVEKYRKQGFAL